MIIEAEYEEMDDAEGELDLSADDSLPWLEAEEEEDTAGDLDTTQVVAFVAFLLITGLLFVGAVWYFGNEGGGEVVADGSMIEAPDGPLKERPKDPGGKEFDGTGNVAPVVGEGGTRDGVIATDGNDEAVRDDGVQQGWLGRAPGFKRARCVRDRHRRWPTGSCCDRCRSPIGGISDKCTRAAGLE